MGSPEESPKTSASGARIIVRRIGLVAGPLLAFVVYRLLPEVYSGPAGDPVPFAAAGRATLAAMAWMGTWWLTEAIDISATALLPLALFPLAGIAEIKATSAPYADEIIFLFMGGFLLALSMQRWALDRRIALITLRLVGTRPVNMIGGVMVATAVLSASVSNTATAAMMMPIALSVIGLLEARAVATTEPGESLRRSIDPNFALCLMLGIAYAASIGGIATIIGTPPNAFLVAYVAKTIDPAFKTNIGFGQWMLLGVPLAAIFLPVTWFVLTRLVFPVRLRSIEGGRAMIEDEYLRLGPMKRGEWATLIVFVATAITWIIRPILSEGIASTHGPAGGASIAYIIPPLVPGLTDAGVAMLGAFLLFVIPARNGGREFVMDWATASKLPWGILILFGGGLSLAAAVKANGVADFIGAQAALLGSVPEVVLVLIVVVVVIFLTELTSNTATTATLVPILAPLAIGFEMHPFLLIVPAALAASCAFMMPVATPPNAIVFGSGHVTIPQMCKAGVWLNLIGTALITACAYTLVMVVLV